MVMLLYSTVAGAACFLSAVSTATIVVKLHRHWELSISAVRWLFCVFFQSVSAWATLRSAFFAWMLSIGAARQVNTNVEKVLTTTKQLDMIAVHSIPRSTLAHNLILALLIAAGDTAVLVVALSMVALTYELGKIAIKSMDRGPSREAQRIYLYKRLGAVFITVYVILEAVIVVREGGYTRATHTVLLANLVLHVCGLFYMGATLVIVYAMFATQFHVGSILLRASGTRSHNILPFMGISLVVFSSSGFALSVITGSSQTCVLQACSACVPGDLKAQFLQHKIGGDNTPFGPVSPPEENPVFVYTDIESSSALWALAADGVMTESTDIHDNILRSSLLPHNGYEITTCGDSFQLAFPTIKDAVDYCVDVQLQLLVASWPKELHGLVPATKRQRCGHRTIFSGLRVRMGVHDSVKEDGALVCERHAITGNMTYTGASEVIAGEISELGRGGQILVTERIAEWVQINNEELAVDQRVENLGAYNLRVIGTSTHVYQIIPAILLGRRKYWPMPKPERTPCENLSPTDAREESLPSSSVETLGPPMNTLLHKLNETITPSFDCRPSFRPKLSVDENGFEWARRRKDLILACPCRYYSTLGVIATFLSAASTGIIVIKLHHHWEISVSSVRWLFCVFFQSVCVWASLRCAFFVWMVNLGDARRVDPHVETALTTTKQLDALGLHSVSRSTLAHDMSLALVVLAGDVALFAVGVWIIGLTYELGKIAIKSMDRGPIREAQRIRFYRWMGTVLVTAFGVSELVAVICERGYAKATHGFLLTTLSLHVCGLVYMSVTLTIVKSRGRKYEPMHSMFVPSPVYQRLKRIMIVYGCFATQYHMSSIVSSIAGVHIRAVMPFMGVSMLLFMSVGLALSVITGCSQTCVLELCSAFVPEDLEAQYMQRKIGGRDVTIQSASAPEESPVFVCTDIESSSALWAVAEGGIMEQAIDIDDNIVRSALLHLKGYEITTCGDSFQLAFPTIRDVVDYCVDVQLQLLVAAWPKQLHGLVPATKRQRCGHRLIFSGLRVRKGIHDSIEGDGALVCEPHAITGNMTYTGASDVIAGEVSELGRGGQILVTERITEWVQVNNEESAIDKRVEFLGAYHIGVIGCNKDVYQIIPAILLGRCKYWPIPEQTRTSVTSFHSPGALTPAVLNPSGLPPRSRSFPEIVVPTPREHTNDPQHIEFISDVVSGRRIPVCRVSSARFA